MKYGKTQLDALRDTIMQSNELSDKRKNHIAAVEQMAIRLGKIYAPEKCDILSAAALLHDLTKEYSFEKQAEICREHGYELSEIDILSPKTLHAMTAAYLIPELFPDFSDEEVLSAVRWHTTGRRGMTLTEKLIYLSDYIDDSRTFADCVTLRNAFFDAEPEKMTESDRLLHLDYILLLAYDMTVTALISNGEKRSPISPDTFEAMNELICRKSKN